jgi:hypothetical protein
MKMDNKLYDTIIIGAGISGLACARHLQENNEDFLIIGEDIGGRILTSDDNTANYGAFFVCSDYHHVNKFVSLGNRIYLRDFCFHEENDTYVLFEPKLIRYSIQFFKIIKILYKFRKSLRNFRKQSTIMSQKSAIEQDPFLYDLYMKDASSFVKEQNMSSGNDAYLSKALYSTTFSRISEMNAFSYLQFLIPLITPIYTFTFEKEKMINPFQEEIMIGTVRDLNYTNKKYKVKVGDKILNAKNIVLATQISWSKKYAGVKKTNKPVDTNMLHIKGIPKKIVSKKDYQLFSYPSNVQAMADLKDGTYLFYYKNKQPNLNDFFEYPKIIAHKYWDIVGTINGHNLIGSVKGNNMYLIGDYNIAGLEESYITGLFAANKIIASNSKL